MIPSILMACVFLVATTVRGLADWADRYWQNNTIAPSSMLVLHFMAILFLAIENYVLTQQIKNGYI
jgi:hypothetical protein